MAVIYTKMLLFKHFSRKKKQNLPKTHLIPAATHVDTYLISLNELIQT